MHRSLRALFVILALAATTLADEQSTTRRFEELRTDPLLLHRFLEEMPNGGDLHEHLSGAVYAETYLAWAMQDGLCIDDANLTLAPPPCDEPLVSAKAMAADSALYSQMIDAMSMRNFHPAVDNGHDHFFATFGKFFAASRRHTPEML